MSLVRLRLIGIQLLDKSNFISDNEGKTTNLGQHIAVKPTFIFSFYQSN